MKGHADATVEAYGIMEKKASSVCILRIGDIARRGLPEYP